MQCAARYAAVVGAAGVEDGIYGGIMKKYIVTGAAGFLGCNLTEQLMQEEDAHIYAVVRPSSPHNARLAPSERLTIVPTDLSDYARLDEMIGTPCDVFFHLAWQGGRYDFAAQYGNIADTLGALEAAARLGCKRFICTGSQAEYGRQTALITEETCPHPADAYGAAKLAACALSRVRAAELGIEWLWGRVFSVYGKYEPETTLLSYLACTLYSGETPQMTAGTQLWDYLYAEDAAAAMTALLVRGGTGEVYNIAHGDVRPLRSFAEEMRMILAPDGTIAYGTSERPPSSMRPSVEKIHADTGWRAQIDFADGVRRTYCEG